MPAEVKSPSGKRTRSREPLEGMPSKPGLVGGSEAEGGSPAAQLELNGFWLDGGTQIP